MARLKQILFLSCLFSGALGVGCTRGADRSSVTVTIPVSNASHTKSVRNGALLDATDPTESTVNRIVINVLGGGTPTPPYIWNAPSGSGSSTAPTSVSLSVPNGITAVVQVLLVIQDDTGQSFEYGSATVNISGDTSVTINTTPIGALGQGTIAGRFLAAGDTVGKTGKLNLLITPPGGLPMVVDTEEIFGGWLSVFSPSGPNAIPMTYQFEDNTVLFTSAANSSSPLLGVPSAASNLLVSLPANVKNWSQTPSGSGQPQAAGDLLFGFFGLGNASTAATCIPSGTSVDGLWTDATYTQPILWTGAVIPTTAAGLATDAYVAQGGVTATTLAACTTAAMALGPSSGLLYPQVSQFGNGGGGSSQALGFSGPFSAISNTDGVNFVSAAQSGAGVTVRWSYNPTAISGVAGVDVFYSNSQTSNDNNNYAWQQSNGNGMDCAGLSTGVYPGFSSATNVPITATPNDSVTVTSAYSSSTFAAVVCPYRMVSGAKSYFVSGVQVAPGGSDSVPVQMALSTTTFAAGTICHPITLTVEDMSGNPYVTTTPMSFSLPNTSPSTSTPGLYASAGCSVAGGTITVPANSSQVEFYVTAATSVGFANVQINPQGGGNGVNFNNWSGFNFAFDASTPPAPTIIGASLQTTNFVQNQCYPVDFQLWDSSNNPAIASGAVTFTPTTTLSGTFHYATDCSDTSPTWTSNPAQIPAGASVLQLYYLAGATDSGNTYLSSAYANDSINSYHTVAGYTYGNTPGSVTIGLSASGGTVTTNTCYQVNVNFYAVSGNIGQINTTNLPQSYGIGLGDSGSGGGGQYFLPSGNCSGSSCCTGTAVTSARFSSSGYTNLYYLTSSSAMSGSIVYLSILSSSPSLGGGSPTSYYF